MKILYVSQYFPPEMGAPAARVHELSRAWARMGHEVTVVTGFAQQSCQRAHARPRHPDQVHMSFSHLQTVASFAAPC